MKFRNGWNRCINKIVMEVDEAVGEIERVATLVPGTIAAITTTAVEVEVEAVDITTIAAAAAAATAAVAMVEATTVVTIVEGVAVMQEVRTIAHGNFAVRVATQNVEKYITCRFRSRFLRCT